MPDAANIFTVLQSAKQFLTSHNIKEAKLDAEILLCDILNVNRSKLFTIRSSALTQTQLKQYKEYLLKRSARYPLAYITGNTEFMGLKFDVNSDVLIPRQETEILAEEALNQIKNNNYKNVLDICTGSGCIAVCIAYYSGDISVTAADISKKAVKTAKKNAKTHKVSKKINFLVSDMFDNIIEQKFDIIISNPPYVLKEEYDNLEEELFFEPENALLAQDNGLYFYRKIAQKAKKYLNNNGLILLELNSNISDKIAALFKKYNFVKIDIIKDYAYLDRILVLKNG